MPPMPNCLSHKDSSLSSCNTLQTFTACHVAAGTLHSIWYAGNEFEDIDIGRDLVTSTYIVNHSSDPGSRFDEWVFIAHTASKTLVSPGHPEAIAIVLALFEHRGSPLCSSMANISTS